MRRICKNFTMFTKEQEETALMHIDNDHEIYRHAFSSNGSWQY